MKSALALLALLSYALALYEPTDDVVELTVENFDSEVVGSSDVWFVEFYAPWYAAPRHKHARNRVSRMLMSPVPFFFLSLWHIFFAFSYCILHLCLMNFLAKVWALQDISTGVQAVGVGARGCGQG
jgi:hypothetical protein